MTRAKDSKMAVLPLTNILAGDIAMKG